MRVMVERLCLMLCCLLGVCLWLLFVVLYRLLVLLILFILDLLVYCVMLGYFVASVYCLFWLGGCGF